MVYDGPASSERVLGRFCGLVNTRQVVSHGNQLSVVLKADSNGVQAQGFAGRFQFVNKHTVQPSKILDDTMRGDSQGEIRRAAEGKEERKRRRRRRKGEERGRRRKGEEGEGEGSSKEEESE